MTKIQVINLNGFEKVYDEELTGEQLLRVLLKSDSVWRAVVELENTSGVEFTFDFEGVTDYRQFVESFISSAISSGFEIEDTQKKAKGFGGEAGFPDFVAKHTGEKDTPHKEDKIFIEFKHGNDALRRNQVEFALNKISDGFDYWVMWVEP